MKFLKQIGWVVTFAIVGLLYLTFGNQSLKDLGGYEQRIGEEEISVRNLRKVMMSAIDNRRDLSLSEEELNLYLAKSIKLSQEGFLSSYTEVKGLWVSLTQDRAELIIEREFFGRKQTVSMYIEIKDDGGIGRYVSYPGGRLGQVAILSGHLLLVMNGFESIAARYQTEVNLITKRFDSFRFEEGKLLLIANVQKANQ